MRTLSVIILLLLIVVHLLSCRPTVASVHVSPMTCAKQLHTSMTGAHCLSGIRFEHADLWSSGVNHQLLLRSFFWAWSVGSSGLITSTVGGPGFRGSQGKLGVFISRFIALYGWPIHVEGNSKDWDIGWVAGHIDMAFSSGLNPHLWRLKLHSLIIHSLILVKYPPWDYPLVN